MSAWKKIIDKATGKIIASGEIVGEKMTKKGESIYLFSFDGKHYFGNNSEKYRVDNNYDHITTPLIIPDNYSVILWKDYIVGMEFDILREYGLDEVDKEIEGLILTLNKFPGIITKSSCSGHGHQEPYITFLVENVKGIASLSWILNRLSEPPFVGNVYLSTIDAYNRLGNISFSLRTEPVGEVAWGIFDKLELILEDDLSSGKVQPYINEFKKKVMESAYHV